MPSSSDRIDAICDRFEAAWLAGRRPRIETVLDEAPGLNRAELLRQLLRVELELRGRAGDEPSQENYRVRFPGHEELIRAAFRDALPAASMEGAHSPADSNALLAMLAVQLDNVAHDALVAALNGWVLEAAAAPAAADDDHRDQAPEAAALVRALALEHREQIARLRLSGQLSRLSSRPLARPAGESNAQTR